MVFFMCVVGSYRVCLLGVHKNTSNKDFLVAFINLVYKICTDKWFYSFKNDNRNNFYGDEFWLNLFKLSVKIMKKFAFY